MIMSILFVIAALVIVFISYKKHHKMDVRFGILGEDDGGVCVAKETVVIPFKLRDELRFGLSFYKGMGVEFIAQVNHYLPAEPVELCGSISEMKSVKTDRGFMIAGRIEKYLNGGIRVFGLSEGDPLGAYELDLLIDGKRVKTIRYQVVSQKVEV